MSKSSISASSSPPSSSARPAACCRPTNSILVGLPTARKTLPSAPASRKPASASSPPRKLYGNLKIVPARSSARELRRAAVVLHQVDAADVVREILFERRFLDQGYRRAERRGDRLDLATFQIDRFQAALVAPSAVGRQVGVGHAAAAHDRLAVVGQRGQLAALAAIVEHLQFLKAVQYAAVDLYRIEGKIGVSVGEDQGLSHGALLWTQFISDRAQVYLTIDQS